MRKKRSQTWYFGHYQQSSLLRQTHRQILWQTRPRAKSVKMQLINTLYSIKHHLLPGMWCKAKSVWVLWFCSQFLWPQGDGEETNGAQFSDSGCKGYRGISCRKWIVDGPGLGWRVLWLWALLLVVTSHWRIGPDRKQHRLDRKAGHSGTTSWISHLLPNFIMLLGAL